MAFKDTPFTRYLLIVSLMVVVALSIIARAAFIMFVQHDYWDSVAKRFVKEDVIVKPGRGNILSSDGRLMASSLPEYKIYMDFKTSERDPERAQKDQYRRDTLIKNNLDEICEGLHRIFPSYSTTHFRNVMLQGMKGRKRNHLIYPYRISYIQYKEVKRLPVFRMSQYRGGFIGKSFQRRKKPFGSLAMRTLGDMFAGYPDSAKNGLEMAYDSILRGENGITHRQKVMNRYLNIVDKPAVDGCDVVTTIDVGMQDIAEKALVDKLEELSAIKGVALLMEVKTGEIKAIVNMTRAGDGKYYEMQNHAVSALMEPGSTFKTASMMVALEDGVVDTSDVVDTGNGIWNMYGSKMKDHNWYNGGYGEISVPRILQVSSNIGVSRIIDENYRSNPGKFVEGLYRIGINADLDLPFKGSANARIRHPRDGNWYKTTLPWMSIGYETQIPPINTLTFYNAIANGGVMVKPKFVKAIMREGKIVEEIPTEVLNEAICSPQTLGKMQDMLESVVSRGLGRMAGCSGFHVSGKTGTAQVAEGGGYKTGRGQYLVSFCGYFPSEDPQYTCLVAIHKYGPGASGGGMAGPVFSKIAQRVMAGNLKQNVEQIAEAAPSLPQVKAGDMYGAYRVLDDLDMLQGGWDGPVSAQSEDLFGRPSSGADGWKVNPMALSDAHRVPDVRGMGAKDAVYLLERQGLNVSVSGKGRVKRQSLQPGSRLVKGQTVRIELN